MNNQITSEYIRGFFDGEGCVSVKGKQIIITNQNIFIMKRIREKLKNIGIISRLYKDKNCYRLKILGYHNIRKFHELVGSNFDVKEKQMTELIDSYSSHIVNETEIEEIIKLRREGLSYRQIAKKTGVKRSTVYNICSKYLRY
jgi:intein-encoded DNA endonuclease-like protein